MVYGRGAVYGEAGRESLLESPEPLLYQDGLLPNTGKECTGMNLNYQNANAVNWNDPRHTEITQQDGTKRSCSFWYISC